MPLDRRLRDEFQRTAAEAPGVVDPDAMISVVDRVGHIRRNRRVAATGSALAVLLVVMVVGVPHLQRPDRPVAPTASPKASPSRSPLGQAFTSSVHEYAMAYPEDWTAAAAGTEFEQDVFRSPTGATVTVSSEPLASGETIDEWAASYLPTAGGSRRRDCFPPRDQWLPVNVGGHPGGLLGGDFGCDLTEAVVFVDRRVYVIDAEPDLPTGLFDQGLLDQMLASVRFGPPTAS